MHPMPRDYSLADQRQRGVALGIWSNYAAALIHIGMEPQHVRWPVSAVSCRVAALYAKWKSYRNRLQ